MNKQPFITVYHPIGGWKAVKMWWNEEDIPGQGFWEPWSTADWAWPTRGQAVEDAKGWAEAEGIEFREDTSNLI